MLKHEEGYLELLADILDNGHKTDDRTGTGTRSLFGPQVVYDLSKGFPLFTTKKVWLKGIIHELLWLLSGSTNINYLVENGVHIWDEWADENGDLGNVYSKQWRDWQSVNVEPVKGGKYNGVLDVENNTVSVDQIGILIERIKSNPTCRRLIVSAWNAGEIHSMALPPCHTLFQFKVYGDTLHCKLYQRSADMFLGVPFNVASYALLTMMVAQVTGLKVGTFTHTFGDAHIYNNHVEQVEEQLGRNIRAMPTMKLNPDVSDIFEFKYEDFTLENYNPHSLIKADVSV